MKITNADFSAISDMTVNKYTDEFPEFAGRIKIERMRSGHVDIARYWPNTAGQKGGYGWDWHDVYHPRRLKEIYLNYTISFDGVLDGMVSCRIEKETKNIAIEYLQRRGGSVDSKGRITPLAVLQAAMVGFAYNFDSVSINNPAPQIVSYYQKHLPNFVMSVKESNQAVTRLLADVEPIVT